MRVLRKDELERERLKIVRALRGCLFIHPTDTVYGIGCNATDRKLVHKLRCAKGQYSRPMSVIAPTVEWVRNNCEVDKQAEGWLAKLPGPHTLILKLKKEKAVAKNANMGMRTLGIRMPRHWFTDVVKDMNVPVITTSANRSGKAFITKLEDLEEELENAVEYALYDGEIAGKPSRIVDLTKEKPEILRE